MSKRVLITGGGGFIASHLVDHLLINTDWEIVILDSMRRVGNPARYVESDHFDPKRVKTLWKDLRTPVLGPQHREIGATDYIINVASESHVDRSIEHPVSFIHNNIMLLLNILEYARKTKPEKFIQVSTDEVYGPASEGHFHKEWEPHYPSNPYSASKSCQEMITFSYWRTYGVPAYITNTMNNFGEKQHPEKLVPKTVKALLRDEPIPIHAVNEDGKWKPGSRVWLHARNHADAILFILNSLPPQKYPDYTRPWKLHIAGEVELDNLQIVRSIAAVIGAEPKCEFVDVHSCRPGHDRRYALNGDLIKDLGWSPPVPFRDSLKRTVEWTVQNQKWLEP